MQCHTEYQSQVLYMVYDSPSAKYGYCSWLQKKEDVLQIRLPWTPVYQNISIMTVLRVGLAAVLPPARRHRVNGAFKDLIVGGTLAPWG